MVQWNKPMIKEVRRRMPKPIMSPQKPRSMPLPKPRSMPLPTNLKSIPPLPTPILKERKRKEIKRRLRKSFPGNAAGNYYA